MTFIIPLIVVLVIGLIVFFIIRLIIKRMPKRICPYCGAEIEDFLEECIYCSGPTVPVSAIPVSLDLAHPSSSDHDDERDNMELPVSITSPSPELENTNKLDTQNNVVQQSLLDDLSKLLIDEDSDDEKILKQLQRTTIIEQIPVLELIKDKKRISKARLSSDMFYLGRETGCDIVINNPVVQARHAVIKDDKTHFTLFSLDVENLVEVNGMKLEKKILEPGDVFRIADLSFVYRLE